VGKPRITTAHPTWQPGACENRGDPLKAGKPGVGAVKTRRKNGDFYWVLATASPIRENGRITGYTSVRTRLAADQRAEAEQVYAAIREKRAHAYRIDAGIIRRRSLFDRLSPFTGTIKTRLVTLIPVQAGVVVAVELVSGLRSGGGFDIPALAVGLFGAVAGALLGARLIRVVSEPLKHLNETMENIVKGKLDGRIFVERDDEIGEA